MKQKLSLVSLGVNNLPATRQFYEETLGFVPHEASNENITFYEVGERLLLGLYPREKLAEDATILPDGSGFPGFTLAHNEPSGEAVDALFAELKEKGVHIVKEPQSTDWGGYSGYFSDPDGYLWEVAHNPFMDLT